MVVASGMTPFKDRKPKNNQVTTNTNYTVFVVWYAGNLELKHLI